MKVSLYLVSMNLNKSKCVGLWLHRFEIIEQWDNAVVEMCGICLKKKVFRIVNGRTNNLEYLSYHLRSALIPQHPLWKHEYPNAK